MATGAGLGEGLISEMGWILGGPEGADVGKPGTAVDTGAGWVLLSSCSGRAFDGGRGLGVAA